MKFVGRNVILFYSLSIRVYNSLGEVIMVKICMYIPNVKIFVLSES